MKASEGMLSLLLFHFHNGNDIWEQTPWELTCIFISVCTVKCWKVCLANAFVNSHELWVMIITPRATFIDFHSVAMLMRFSYWYNLSFGLEM